MSGWTLLLLKWHPPMHSLEFFPSGPWLPWGFGPDPSWSQQGISPVGSVWSESPLLHRSAEWDTCGVLLRAAWPESKEAWECKIYLRKGTIQPSSMPRETMPWIHVRNQITLGRWVKKSLVSGLECLKWMSQQHSLKAEGAFNSCQCSSQIICPVTANWHKSSS